MVLIRSSEAGINCNMFRLAAISAGISFVDAFLNSNASLYSEGDGVNFAVAGSTALPSYILADKKISSPVTNSSLSTQLDWMFTYFNGICYNYDGKSPYHFSLLTYT